MPTPMRRTRSSASSRQFRYLLLLALALAVAFGIYAGRQLTYDQCLDTGGMIEYSHRVCVTEDGERPLREFVLGTIGISVFVLVVLPLAGRAVFRVLRSRFA